MTNIDIPLSKNVLNKKKKRLIDYRIVTINFTTQLRNCHTNCFTNT